MNIASGLLSLNWVLVSFGLFALVLFVVLRQLPWGRFRDTEHQHVYFAAIVFLMVLWSMRAGISPGLAVHFLGVTALTLMFGAPAAIVAVTLVLVGEVVAGKEGWEALPTNALLQGVVPALVTAAVRKLAERYLPPHFFIYIFVICYGAALVATAASVIAISLVFWLGGLYASDHIIYEYLPYLPLVMFPEAVLNGMVITMLVLLRPHWVWSYDDARYVDGK